MFGTILLTGSLKYCINQARLCGISSSAARSMRPPAMQTIDQALDKLSRSAFRSSFHLTKRERLYLEEKGMDVIRRHAADFVRQRLAPADPANDG
ncbi:MAG: DUF4186 family protein, partial [Desulfovibrionaceae bacterium]|nr:DUF4186 family protein [Desulfovibrionaceae bacterium]